ncbi:MAG: RNA polymerase factor sigma-54 [Bacteroidales bacterium]|nr:RNA polymerase factor sigma-54 [Bacteroidales bacterium]
MKQRITTEIKQTQRLTPLQVQFVRMLEMTGPEMEDEVHRALDEMPALEAVDDSHMQEGADAETVTEDGDKFTESSDEMQRADFSSEDEMPGYLDTGQSHELLHIPVYRGTYARDMQYPEQSVGADGEGLTERLMRQVAELPLDEKGMRVARYIVGNIDPNGYLTRSLQAIADDIAIHQGEDVDMEEMDRILEMVRGLDPAGVGATDLRDCLLLQLRRLPRTASTLTAVEIVANNFDLLAKKHYSRIAGRLGISVDDVNEAAAIILRLDPKPGGGVPDGRMEDSSRGISPDFFVEASDDGVIHLSSLNRVPELRIESSFADDDVLASDSVPNHDEARAFIRSKRDDARNFIRVVNMRQQTLFNVMSAIVKLQRDFFLSEDEEDIKPMVLKDVAALTGYDLSVISRATQGKYVATLRGIYPLKKFFNERLRDDDDSVTSNKVMALIREAIEGEDKHHPLSDREITQRLADAGLDIARRTVAKYREGMGIQVARLRRQV